jgi:hypothetical protein
LLVFQKLIDFLHKGQTFKRLPTKNGSVQLDSYDGDVFLLLAKAAAIYEEYFRLLFALYDPFKHFLQVPELLVIRLLLQQTIDIVLEVAPLDVKIISEVDIFEHFLIAATRISDQLFGNQHILQLA